MSHALTVFASVALGVGSLAGASAWQAGRQDAAATDALRRAVGARAAQVAAAEGTLTLHDDAVRVGPALVPARTTLVVTPGGVAGRVHGTVRAAGPGGVPVVASASAAGR